MHPKRIAFLFERVAYFKLKGIAKIPRMPRVSLILIVATLGVSAFEGTDASEFQQDIRPLLENYCFGCHDDTARGGINLEALSEKGAFWRDPKVWEKALAQLGDRVMPPAKKEQPKEEERARILDWLRATLETPDLAIVPRDPGRSVIHRLSRLEYNNTVRDLLGVDTQPADKFPPDGGGGGGFDNNAATLYVPPILMERYLEAATEIVGAATPARLFAVRPTGEGDARAAARENVKRLAFRAFRRPVEEEQIERLLALYDEARKGGESWEEGVRLCVRALLVSPSFLFRMEDDRPGDEPVRLGDFEIACRLSYFLWSSMPDDNLLEAATAKKLHDPAEVAAQVRRMLADPKAAVLAENFVSQWLRTREMKTAVNPARDKFPEFTPALRDAMYQEVTEFFQALLREDRTLTDLLDCNYSYANGTLAKYYGLPGIEGDEFRRVELTDRNRGGVITMGAVLTLTSYPRRTSPVLRGKWVMEEILGTPPPPPPPMIKILPTSDQPKNGLTFRQQLEFHRRKVECTGCHTRMDPLGMGLENFNPIGLWRTEIAGQPVDANGELPDGRRFASPAEMKAVLLERKDDFVRNLTERMLSYALGRGIEAGDWITVRQIANAVAKDGYRAQRLVIEIAGSYSFQYRNPSARPKSASTQQ